MVPEYPVILVEGLDGVGKSTLVNALTDALGATLVANPIPLPDPNNSEMDLRVRMDKAPEPVRREYYRCANFHASLLINEARQYGPVVVDRYWPSTAGFAMLDEQPPVWESIGSWPRGLVEPDIMFLLTVDEHARTKRMNGRGIAITEEEVRLSQSTASRQRVNRALRCFDPIEIDTSYLDPDEVLHEVIEWLLQAGILFEENSQKVFTNPSSCSISTG